MEENQKKAFDFAADLTKQLITLSTAIVTLTVTFSKDIIGGIDDSIRYLLLLSWVAFIISIILGILTLMALTGNLDPIPKTKAKDNEVTENKPILTITSKNVTGTSKLQVYTFLIALILTCSYGYLAAKAPKKENHHKDCYMIIREIKLGVDTTAHIDTLWIEKQK
ncbi:MAG: hypothetical protein JXQ26_11265 [Tissierellales bacterium]|nr:hypothetical protein [Tissierellales bacterium]